MSAHCANANGKATRKQLSDQLDRLDTIIDALADALPEAVKDACKEGAREAVKEAIVEIFTNPELRSLLSAARPEPVAAVTVAEPRSRKPNFWDRFKALKSAAAEYVSHAARSVKDYVFGPIKAVRETMSTIVLVAGEKVPAQRMLLISLGVGLVVAVGCYLVPQEMAALVSGITSATTALVIQVGSWLRQTARRFGLVA